MIILAGVAVFAIAFSLAWFVVCWLSAQHTVDDEEDE